MQKPEHWICRLDVKFSRLDPISLGSDSVILGIIIVIRHFSFFYVPLLQYQEVAGSSKNYKPKYGSSILWLYSSQLELLCVKNCGPLQAAFLLKVAPRNYTSTFNKRYSHNIMLNCFSNIFLWSFGILMVKHANIQFFC